MENLQPRFSEQFSNRINQEKLCYLDSFGLAMRVHFEIRERMSDLLDDVIDFSEDDQLWKVFVDVVCLNDFDLREEDNSKIVEDACKFFSDMVNDQYYSKDHGLSREVAIARQIESNKSRNHILLNRLPPGEKEVLDEEALYWDIYVPSIMDTLSQDSANAILNAFNKVKNLPPESQRIFKMDLDGYLLGHSLRTAIFSSLLAQRCRHLKIGPAEIALAGFFHDIGKLHPLIRLLTKKPGRLSKREFQCVKLHPDIGTAVWDELHEGEYLDIYDPDSIIRDAIYKHHLRKTKGYPEELDSSELNPFVEIIGICDSWDAMTSSRIYNPDSSVERAEAELRRCSGLDWDRSKTRFQYNEDLFDPVLVKKFLDMRLKPIIYKPN